MSEPGDLLDMSIVGALQRVKRPGFLQNLVSLFERDSQRLLAELQEAIASSNAKDLNELGHSLKSAGGSIGAKHVAELAGALETIGFEGTTEGAAAVFANLEVALTEAHEALTALVSDS